MHILLQETTCDLKPGDVRCETHVGVLKI